MTPVTSYKTDPRHSYLSTYLRELRRNSGYTQDQVARSVNLSRQSLSKIENNGFFRIESLYTLADFYEITLRELFADII